MKQPASFLLALPLFLAVAGCGSDAGQGAGRELVDAFCGPALARVDSFMATFSDRDWDEERYGGMAVVGTVADFPGMSVSAAQDVGGAQHQQFVNLMTLLEFDEDLNPTPYLARSWEISDDRTEITFFLRDDVYWHDGHPTTAHDVAFTFETVRNPDSGYPNLAFFLPFPPGEEAFEVVDSFTVRFRFQPHADFLETWRNLSILPEHLLGDVPTANLAGHPYGGVCPVGNGPYRFVSRTPGESWTFEANPAFPEDLGGRPYLDRYLYRVIPSKTTLQAELLTGGIDVYIQMLANHVDPLEEEGLDVWAFRYPSIFFVAWNSRVPELADARVRRALTLGINRPQLIEGIHGGDAALLNTGLPPTHWAFDPTFTDSLAFDPDGARALLDEAGWVDRDGDGIRENDAGEPLHIDLFYNQEEERQRVGEIVRGQLAEIGVELVTRVTDMATFRTTLTSPERGFDAALVTFETGFRIDERDLFHSEMVDGLFAFSGTRDPELDRYLDTIPLIPDQEDALPVWRAYQLRIMELQPYTFLYSAFRRNGVNPRLQGVRMDTRGDLASIRHWWLGPEDRNRN